ncbi:MAG: phosphatase PAP2 family protein [Candidatus Neomarinimicrobiota bacterium]
MLTWLINVDQIFFQFINGSMSNAFFDWIMPIITEEDNWIIPMILFPIGLLFFGKKRGRIAVILLILAVVLTDVLAAQIIKPWVGRLRPSHALLENINLLVSKGGKYGFVSNHAANMFSASVVLGYFFRKWKVYLFSGASIIAFSRVYVGVHYPGDVIFGGLFGYGIAWMMISAWVIIKMRELKRGRQWVWYEDEELIDVSDSEVEIE